MTDAALSFHWFPSLRMLYVRREKPSTAELEFQVGPEGGVLATREWLQADENEAFVQVSAQNFRLEVREKHQFIQAARFDLQLITVPRPGQAPVMGREYHCAVIEWEKPDLNIQAASCRDWPPPLMAAVHLQQMSERCRAVPLLARVGQP